MKSKIKPKKNLGEVAKIRVAKHLAKTIKIFAAQIDVDMETAANLIIERGLKAK